MPRPHSATCYPNPFPSGALLPFGLPTLTPSRSIQIPEYLLFQGRCSGCRRKENVEGREEGSRGKRERTATNYCLRLWCGACPRGPTPSGCPPCCARTCGPTASAGTSTSTRPSPALALQHHSCTDPHSCTRSSPYPSPFSWRKEGKRELLSCLPGRRPRKEKEIGETSGWDWICGLPRSIGPGPSIS